MRMLVVLMKIPRDRQTQLSACFRSVIDQLCLSLSLQVIGLLDVFTPAAALEDFNEL